MKNLMLISIAVALVTVGCSKHVSLPNDAGNPSEQIEYRQALKENRPDWTEKGLWTDGEYIYQVGQSMVFSTEREAKKHAYRDAAFRLSEYVNQRLKSEFSQMLVSQNDSQDTTDQQSATKETNTMISESFISTIAPHESYTELRMDTKERIGYTAFAVVRVKQKEIKASKQLALKNTKGEEEQVATVSPSDL